jgi:ketosteroid isomerase-like protein
MRRFTAAPLAALLIAAAVHAQPLPPAPDAAALTALLDEFLAGASRNDAAVHERFWADDLVYTGSGGRRVGKADILKDVRTAPPAKPGDPRTEYGAEDVRIQQYGTTAIVAFRLVATTVQGDSTEVANYLNSGTFLKRGGRWQVVCWQATRAPAPAPPPAGDADHR